MSWFRSQFSNHKDVIPEQKWSEKDRCFYLNSEAGLIRFKPKNTFEISSFRDDVMNRFDTIRRDKLEGEDVSRKLFKLYSEIRWRWSVRYTANFHTRLKGKLCRLNPFF